MTKPQSVRGRVMLAAVAAACAGTLAFPGVASAATNNQETQSISSATAVTALGNDRVPISDGFTAVPTRWGHGGWGGHGGGWGGRGGGWGGPGWRGPGWRDGGWGPCGGPVRDLLHPWRCL